MITTKRRMFRKHEYIFDVNVRTLICDFDRMVMYDDGDKYKLEIKNGSFYIKLKVNDWVTGKPKISTNYVSDELCVDYQPVSWTDEYDGNDDDNYVPEMYNDMNEFLRALHKIWIREKLKCKCTKGIIKTGLYSNFKVCSICGSIKEGKNANIKRRKKTNNK